MYGPVMMSPSLSPVGRVTTQFAPPHAAGVFALMNDGVGVGVGVAVPVGHGVPCAHDHQAADTLCAGI